MSRPKGCGQGKTAVRRHCRTNKRHTRAFPVVHGGSLSKKVTAKLMRKMAKKGRAETRRFNKYKAKFTPN